MKKRKRYPARPPADQSSPSSRQTPASDHSLSSHPWLSEERPQLSNQMNQVQNLSRQITEATSQMEKWLQTFSKFSHLVQDRKVFDDLLSNRKRSAASGGTKKPSGSGSPGTTLSPETVKNKDEGGSSSIPKPHSEDGDSLYDLINAPGMKTIVDQVMKSRSDRKKKKK